MQETLGSTQRSAQHLHSAEQHGTNTARNLLEQREKLERTEKNLDEINYTTQQTQRSLNSLKSVFGGFFKNKFSKAPQKTQAEVSNSNIILINFANLDCSVRFGQPVDSNTRKHQQCVNDIKQKYHL
jgi:synaptosomal-associated protein 29